MPVARRGTEPARDVLPQLLEAGSTPPFATAELRDPSDMHVRSRRLDFEKRRVEC